MAGLILRGLALVSVSALLAGCAAVPPAGDPGARSPLGTVAAPSRSGPTAPAPLSSGPKKRIAVATFDGAGGSDVGGGLSSQLTAELLKTGRFVVLERADLASVLREQELSVNKLTSPGTAVRAGRLAGAQLLVSGSVTEFEQRAGGGGLRIGVGLPGVGGAIGGNSVSGHVGIDLRLVDTTTGQVVQSHRAEGRTTAQAFTGDLMVRNITFGGDTFARTPLGQAAREAIARAVTMIVASMERVPWTGEVVDVAGEAIYVNAGADAGMTPGQVLTVSSIVRELTDPVTGARLGIIEEPLGDIRIDDVKERFSVARALSPMRIARGDLLRVKAGRAPLQVP
jgi:curli biogenesis system outer membrane secretion channel CsgG